MKKAQAQLTELFLSRTSLEVVQKCPFFRDYIDTLLMMV